MKAKWLRKMTLMTLAMTGLMPGPSASASVTEVQRMIAFAPIRDYSRGMNFKVIQPMESLRAVSNDDIAKIIPADLRPYASGAEVATQILDHSLSNFLNSPAIRNSDFGRTAQKVEQTMDGEATFGGVEEDSIRHTVKFQMRAAQTKAQLEYCGLTNAQLSYNISQSQLDIEIHEDLADNTRIVFNHIAKPDDQVEMLSVRWAW